jgi:membrane-associated phospholipid phosphatase
MYSIIIALALSSTTDQPSQVYLPPAGGCTGSMPSQPYPSTSIARKPAPRSDVVLQWNETVLNAIRADRTAPPLAARNLAMVHAAMYDSINAIYRMHYPYYVTIQATPDTTAEAAAAVAAHRTLVTLYPKQIALFDAALDESLERVPNGPGKVNGIRLGQQVAETILGWRSQDRATYQVAYTPLQGAGFWRPTPPDFRPPLLPHWSSVTCFCMKSGAQFRPAGPPPLDSAAYVASYLEVKALGSTNSNTRTPEQTDIAWFWADDTGTVTPPGHWNQIAQVVARDRGTSLAENARLFALLNLALADAGIASWDCKFKYNVWRPIEAIRKTDPRAPVETRGDPNWTPLLNTPPFPSYTSGHSTFSGAAAAVLANFFGNDNVRFTISSDGLPRVWRSFTSFSAAAAEAGRSRIYGGIHWEFDNADGLAAGRALGEYVTANYLNPKPQQSAGNGIPVITAQQGR